MLVSWPNDWSKVGKMTSHTALKVQVRVIEKSPAITKGAVIVVITWTLLFRHIATHMMSLFLHFMVMISLDLQVWHIQLRLEYDKASERHCARSSQNQWALAINPRVFWRHLYRAGDSARCHLILRPVMFQDLEAFSVYDGIRASHTAVTHYMAWGLIHNSCLHHVRWCPSGLSKIWSLLIPAIN